MGINSSFLYVAWDDHHSDTVWQSVEEVSSKLSKRKYINQSVGHYVTEDEKYLILALNKSQDGDYSDLIYILKNNIVKRKKLKL